MKRVFAMACVLLLLLAACGGEQDVPEPVDAAAAADALLGQEGLFSDVLEEVAQEVGLTLYGIDGADLTEGVFYLSGGATAEEFAILTAVDSAAAERTAQACRDRLDRQTEAMRDYQPGEAAKLKAAVIRTEGNTVILLVPAAGVDGEQAIDNALAP